MNETSAPVAGYARARPPSGIGHPLVQLTLVRIREFIREPEAIFWAIFFPILLTAGPTLIQLAPQIATLGAWVIVCFTLALKLFRWR
jgi:hypothetical protein